MFVNEYNTMNLFCPNTTENFTNTELVKLGRTLETTEIRVLCLPKALL